MDQVRIKFYSVSDMSTGWFLHKIEEYFLEQHDSAGPIDINTALEMFNIKKFLDSGARLIQWETRQVEEYKRKGNKIPQYIGSFCSTLSDANFSEVYSQVEIIYADDFWELVCTYKVYVRISPEVMFQILKNDENAVWLVLQHKELSIKYGSIIAMHLVQNPYTAEKLMSNFLGVHDREAEQLFFPESFNQEMRQQALLDYVESEYPNINYLQLLEQSQGTDGLKLPDKLRYKAKKKKEFLQEKIFSRNSGMEYGAEVSFGSIPDGSIQQSLEHGIIKCRYSREWIEDNQDYPTLLNNFIYMFGFVDNQFRASFVSLTSQMGIFERTMGVKGKKDYLVGIAFQSKRILSILQMIAYNQELQQLGIRLENIFQWFFEEYLRCEFGAIGFTYSPPSSGTTVVEKCKLLASAIDGVLKQYRLYCEDGIVNRELLEMSSGHIVFDSLKGCLENKYIYASSDTLLNEMFLLFSDQSMMSFTRKTESKYRTVPELLLSEKIRRDDYEEYQLQDLNWLIGRGSITVTSSGLLTTNRQRVSILKDLFYNEVICPNYYSDSLNEQLEALIQEGELCYGSTLFSKPEQAYLNFVLNKSEYSNGLDLRNRYIHDTCSQDEAEQRSDYAELQKIMVLIIIKINEELCIRERQKSLDNKRKNQEK